MAEVVLLLLRRWWWWCLMWVYLAASVRAVPAAAAAAGQGQCEVLDSNIQSTFSLPTNFTVKSTAPGWLLDFALREEEAPATACVRLQETEAKIQMVLFKGDCMNGVIQDHSYLPGASVPPHAWTTLALDVKDNTVYVTAPNSDSIPLKAVNWSLPRDALQVTVARNVEAAVGCRDNCPLHRHASGGADKKKTVKKSCQEEKHFYFRPGNEFVRLEYEVTCTTTEGTKVFLPITHIVPPHHLLKGMWYMIKLQHLDGEVEVLLDYKCLKKEKLPKGCTFTEHTIRLVGDSHFSFSCNPYTGEVEGVEDDRWYCSTNTQSYFKYYPWAAVLTLTGVVANCLLFVVHFAWKQQDKYPWVIVVTLVVVVVACLLWVVYCVRKLRQGKVKAVRILHSTQQPPSYTSIPPTT